VAGKFSPRLMGRKAADWTLPSNPADYAPWLRAGGRDLVKVLRATDLYLLAWGRVGLDDPRVGISGDRALLQQWVVNSAV
jgi:hypothetical protein